MKPKVVLVNLISMDYLTRYQAPLAVNVLAGYLHAKIPNIPIEILDMQKIFKTHNNDGQTVAENFQRTIDQVITEILDNCQKGPTLVGLSIKWTTQKIAQEIIERVHEQSPLAKPLFIIGNIGATHGYHELLLQPSFQDVLAVVGEGEEALTQIGHQARTHLTSFCTKQHYQDIAGVAVNLDGNIHLCPPQQIDLANYPRLEIVNPADIYDEEWDVHALETSRGCPWGRCKFCSIRKQFDNGQPNNRDNNNWRWRGFAVDKVLDDIRKYAALGVRKFDFKDSEFFGPMKTKADFETSIIRAEMIAKGILTINEELKENNDNVPDKTISITHVSARVDTIYSSRTGEEERNVRRKNVYALLKSCGLRRVYLGIESGSPTQLKRFCKGVPVSDNLKAITILRELGLEIEVGFIFFDYLATLDDLHANIAFIEKSRIHQTDSRILGSLRIQKGSPYVDLARKENILGQEDPGQLSYQAKFLDSNVESIEKIFTTWEKATRALVKILPRYLRIASYQLDFYFLKALIACFRHKKTAKLADLIDDFVSQREELLLLIGQEAENGRFGKHNQKLLREYLALAQDKNNRLISQTKNQNLAA